jgi:acetolactate decarboxylase
MKATLKGLPLAKAAAIQPEFDFRHIRGTLVGIWAPQFASALNVVGYHFHFLSDRTKGGHLLECSGTNLRVRVEKLNDFHLSFPESEEFLRADLTKMPQRISPTLNTPKKGKRLMSNEPKHNEPTLHRMSW